MANGELEWLIFLFLGLLVYIHSTLTNLAVSLAFYVDQKVEKPQILSFFTPVYL
jgi:hypothetical protein